MKRSFGNGTGIFPSRSRRKYSSACNHNGFRFGRGNGFAGGSRTGGNSKKVDIPFTIRGPNPHCTYH